MELHTAYLVQAHANFNHQRVKHLHMEGHTPPNIVSYNSLEIYPPVETGEGPRPASEDTQLIDEFYTSVFGEPPKHEPVLLQTSHVSPKDEVRETGTNFSGSSISPVSVKQNRSYKRKRTVSSKCRIAADHLRDYEVTFNTLKQEPNASDTLVMNIETTGESSQAKNNIINATGKKGKSKRKTIVAEPISPKKRIKHQRISSSSGNSGSRMIGTLTTEERQQRIERYRQKRRRRDFRRIRYQSRRRNAQIRARHGNGRFVKNSK
mmetsp:Transcript_6216/g.7834  ORF Transcript_6216/g.7834 Transcript_6216/m.7834 type:complete len:264 (-) Transcript_6216:276-1067(-)